MPFGERFECGWYRVYDTDGLAALTDSFSVLDCRFARRISPLEWTVAGEADLAGVRSRTLPINGVAMLELRKD